MRTQICDINMYPPTPKVASLVIENSALKTNNNSLKYVLGGIAAVGLIALLLYFWNEYQDEQKRHAR